MLTHIVVADDHQIMREGLVHLLEEQPNLRVIGQAENGREAIRMTHELAPDVVLMDITMPDCNGIEATQAIVARQQDTKIIALSMHAEAAFVTEMLRAGAAGYLLKYCAFDELTQAIRTVLDGKAYLSPQVASIVVASYRQPAASLQQAESDPLSPREREVLQLLANGNSTKEIAAVLCISAKTVETHRKKIMSKLQMRSVADLTKYAIRQGLATVDRDTTLV